MKKRLVFSGLISIFLIVVLLIGSTYSLFVTSNVDDNLNVYKTGNLNVTYTVSNNNEVYSSSIPVSSDAVDRVKPYRITVNNVGNVPYKFNVILNNTTATDSIDSKYVVTKVGKLDPKTLDNCENGVIKKDVIVPAGESAIIDVRVYLNNTIENTEIGNSFYANLSIDGVAIYNENDEIDNSILALPKKTLVCYDVNGGVITEGDECIEVESSSKYNDFPVVSRVGYTFVGWFTEDDVEVTEGNDLVTEDDHTLEAKWSPKTYTVTFDKNSCTATPSVASKTVTYNEEYGELSITSRENYTFVGWFTKPVGGQLVTSTSKVLITENQTLYAYCSQTEYVVSFDANKGEVEPSSIIVAKGEVYGELPVPTRSGYTFGGWYTDPENGELVTENTVVGINAPQTLYAHWNAISYTVTFDANGGGTPSMVSKTVTYDQLYGGLATVERSGYSFDGWYSEAIGGTKIESTSKVIALGAHTLYAHWSANSYTVTFDANGEGATVSPSSYTVNFGEEYGEMPTPVRAGYRFDGWFTESSGGSQVTSSTAVIIAGAHTLYAHWSVNKIDITLNENGTNAGTTGYSVSLSTSSTSDNAPSKFIGTTSGSTISFNEIVAGTTYYIWAGKSSNAKTTRLYSGVSFTAQANDTQTAIINYYGLTLVKGMGISDVSNGGVNTTNEVQYLYNSSSPQAIAIDATVINGYDWDTWTSTGTALTTFTAGTKSQSIKMGAGAATLTASASIVGIDFLPQTIEKDFSTSVQTFDVTSATGGSGSFRYEEVSEFNSSGIGTSYITLSETGTITLAASTRANTYTYTIKAIDLVTGLDKQAIYTIIVNKVSVTCTVGITGKNTFNQNLTATVDTVSDGVKSYVWYSNSSNATSGGNEISGATSSIYKIGSGLVGKYIYVLASVGEGTNYTATTCKAITNAANNTTATVVKANLSASQITVTPYTGTYDGSPHYATISTTIEGLTIVSGPTDSYGTTVKSGTVAGESYDLSPSRTVPGETNVSYKVNSADYNDYTGTTKVIITKNPATISYDTTTVTKTYGDGSFTNTLTNTGDGTVTYSSSNTNVATVNSSTGEVTINGAGDATITATVTDGTYNTYETKTATYILTVAKASFPVNEITVTSYTGTYDGSAHSATISSTIAGLNIVSGSSTSYGTTVVSSTVAGTTYNLSPAKTTAGAYTIYYKITSANYNDYEGTTSITIGKKIPTMTVNKTSLVLTYPTADTFTYTYDGDGDVDCVSSDITRATCSVNTSAKIVTVTPVNVTDSSISVGLYAMDGTNYSALGSESSPSKTVSVTVVPGGILGSVTIKGINTYGQTLTADVENPSNADLSYQWYSNSSNSTSGGDAINGATGSTYTIGSGLADKYIYVVVTAEKENSTTTTWTDITDVEENTTAIVQRVELPSIPTVSMTGYTYGGTKSTPSVSGNIGNGTVTYYYNTTNSNSGGIAWTNVTDAKTLNAGTYYLYAVISDSTNYKGATTAAVSFTIAKGICEAPSNLAVSTAGIVTFDGFADASSHQISIDDSDDWTNFTSGSSYLSTIIDSTGTREVYVRSVCDSTNYSSSEPEKVDLVVYEATINSNNTSYGTVDTDSYNVISGATYTTSGNTLTFKGGTTTLKTVNATKIDATGHSTSLSGWSPANGTITSATTITANFSRTANSYAITLVANGCGTITGTNPFYAKYGTDDIYTSSAATTVASAPGLTVNNGYTFNGWYTAASGGSKVLTTAGALTGTAVSGYTTENTWVATSAKTLYAQCSAGSYTVTVNAGLGVESLTASDWTGTGTATISKTYSYEDTVDLASLINLTYKSGYSGESYVKASGAGSITNNILTVGAGDIIVTANATVIETPIPTVSIASTSKIYGSSTTALSATVSNNYDSGITVNYTYYYDISSSGSFANTQTASISALSHKGLRYYKVKATATDGTITSSVGTSSNNVSLELVRAELQPSANNCGTISSADELYVYSGETQLYDRDEEEATWPTLTPETGYIFNGWYTAASGGSKVLTNTGALTGTAVSGYTSASAWAVTENKTLYAQCSPATYTVTLNKGSCDTNGTASITATYGSSVISPANITLANGTSYTISGFGLAALRNSDGATVSSTSTITSTKSLNGYYSEMSSAGVKVLNASTTASFTPSATGYTDANGNWIKESDATLYANCSRSEKTLPTITKSGYTCGWTTSSTGTTITYESGGSIKPSANTTLYGVCVPNKVTVTLKENGSNATTTGYSVSLSTSSTSDTATFTGTTSGATISFEQIVAGTTYYIWAGKSSRAKTTRLYSGVSFTADANATQTAIINYYGLTLAKGTNINSVSNGGTNTTSAVNYLYNSSSPQLILIDATPTSGYQFSTWTKTLGTTLKTFTAGTKSQYIQMGAGATTLTASAPNLMTYTITYNCNGGSNPSTGTVCGTTQPKTHGVSVTLSTVVPTNTKGYTFLGWGTSSTTTAATYTGGSGISVDTSNNSYTLNESNTLYAVWGYKVNFYPGDDFNVDLPFYAEDYKICGIGSSASTSGKTCTINLPGVYGVSDSANYYIGAWELYGNQSDTVGYPRDTYTVTNNITLYAFLYKKNYCITYDTTMTVSECDCSNDEYYTGRFTPSGTEDVCYYTNSYNFIDQSSSSEIQLLSGTDNSPLEENLNITIPSGKTVLIDFNDHYLSFVAGGRGDFITNNGTLIITNSNATSNAYLYGIDGNNSIGSVIVNNGTLTIARKIVIESNNTTNTTLPLIKNSGTMYVGMYADDVSNNNNFIANQDFPITLATPTGYVIENTSTGILNYYYGTRAITGGTYTIKNSGTDDKVHLYGGRLYYSSSAVDGPKIVVGSGWQTGTNASADPWIFKAYVNNNGTALTAPITKYSYRSTS